MYSILLPPNAPAMHAAKARMLGEWFSEERDYPVDEDVFRDLFFKEYPDLCVDCAERSAFNADNCAEGTALFLDGRKLCATHVNEQLNEHWADALLQELRRLNTAESLDLAEKLQGLWDDRRYFATQHTNEYVEYDKLICSQREASEKQTLEWIEELQKFIQDCPDWLANEPPYRCDNPGEEKNETTLPGLHGR
jgi:hypothetical protein